MKKIIVVLLAIFTALAAVAQQAEIYPEIGPQVNSGSGVSFSPDGKWILTNVGIWDAASGRELKRRYNTSIIGWSPDMKRYLQGSGSSIYVRDWETDAESFNIQAQAKGAVFSPDGKQIIAITNDKKNIKIWDAANGQEILNIAGTSDSIGRFNCNQDGKTIMFRETSEKFNTIKVFDLVNKRQLRSFQINQNDDDAFSPDGKRYIEYVSTGDRGQTQHSIKIYDMETGRELRTLAGFNGSKVNGSIQAFAYRPDSKQIVSIERNNSTYSETLKIWDPETGREIKAMKQEYTFIFGINYSPDNKRLVYRSNWGGLIVLDAESCREIMAIKSLKLLSSPDSIGVNYLNDKQAIFQTKEDIQQWDTETGQRTWVMSIIKPNEYYRAREIYFSPDKLFFAKTEDQSNNKKIQINIYSTSTGRQVKTWQHIVNVSSSDELINDWGLFWSQDGEELASYVGSNILNTATLTARSYLYINFWNVSDGKLISTNRHDRGSISGNNANASSFSSGPVYFSPDASRIVYQFGDSLQVYETRGTRKLFTITGSFNRVRWSSNSTRILTVASDGTVRQWDAQNGKQLPGSVKHDSLSDVEYSLDGKQFATCGDDKFVRAWNAENSAKLWETNTYGEPRRITYSADGKRLIVGNFLDESVRILDSTNGNVLFSRSERSASFSADGKWIVTASQDGTVRIWSAETYIEKARLIAFDDGEWLAMTPDGYYTASAKGDQYLNARVGNTVTGIDRYRSIFNKPAIVAARLSTSGRMAAHKDAISSAALNPGGTRIVTASLDKTIKLWDLESGKELRTITGIGGAVNVVSFSPDGKTLVHGAEDKAIKVWDAETGRQIRTISGHTDYVNEARYSPDGKRIASCADDKLIKIWDAESGREIRTLSGHTDLVCVTSWSPDGKRIVSGSDKAEKTIRIWDAESGRVLQTIPGQGGRIMGIAYSPDGKKIASCSADEPALKIWDAETGRQIKSIPIEDGAPYSLAWSPDGKRIAVGYIWDKSDGCIYIVDTETGAEIHDIWISGVPQSLTWTPDGRRIITACNFSDAQVIKVFDALSGREL